MKVGRDGNQEGVGVLTGVVTEGYLLSEGERRGESRRLYRGCTGRSDGEFTKDVSWLV